VRWLRSNKHKYSSFKVPSEMLALLFDDSDRGKRSQRRHHPSCAAGWWVERKGKKKMSSCAAPAET